MESIFNTIKTDVKNEIYNCNPPYAIRVITEEEIEEIASYILSDLMEFAAKDPAARNSAILIYYSYLSFRAVYYYRIAHFLHNKGKSNGIDWYIISARRLSEVGKLISGVEIHPNAKIGVPFVVDHGHGTVIGETTVIGNSCYVLQGVTLGARGIACNPDGKRHPSIGNNVQIGGHAQIFGPITIGDNVFISPNSFIITNIPANSRVSIVNQLQVIKHVKFTPYHIYGVVPFEDKLLVYGRGLSELKCSLSIDNKDLILSTAMLNDTTMLVQPKTLDNKSSLKKAVLKFSVQDSVIVSVLGISHLLQLFC